MEKKPLRPSSDIDTLLEIMKLLRSPQGCPWDKEQTNLSLMPYTLEEAYEVVDAVESGNRYKICEELGDLLLQIVFYCQIAHEQGEFRFSDVVLSITDKLIRRHPHVFADQEAATPGEVNTLWQEVKEQETGYEEKKLPPLPSLLLLDKMAGKLDLSSVEDPLMKQILTLIAQAKQENRCLETEIRRICAKFWS